MKKIIFILTIFILMPVYAARNPSVENSLIGTWKLISMTNENLITGKKSNDYGSNPIGYLNYSPHSRMMVIIVKNDRNKSSGSMATPDEAVKLLGSMTSYAGTYSVRKNQIIHHVDVAWNPSWVGTNQVRFYKLKDKYLVLTTPSFIDPEFGKITVHLLWKKIA